MTRIVDAHEGNFLADARLLFIEYAESLDIGLDFQGFDDELAALPGRYAPPAGCLLLALVDGEVAGCVALRDLGGEIGEVKRLWVRPAFRGRRVGRALAEQVLERAREAGYQRLRLDTLASMDAANGLYRSLGFREIEAYYHNPNEDAVFFELCLEPGSRGGLE